MLTVLPPTEFKQLIVGLSESSENYKFSYNDLTENHAETYSDVIDYMHGSNCKFVGKGSSRLAFFIPPRSIQQDRSIPCCLKVAKNKPGVAQNHAEVDIFNKYGIKTECFPELFDYDKNKYYFILTEVGERIFDEINTLSRYFKEWNKFKHELNPFLDAIPWFDRDIKPFHI